MIDKIKNYLENNGFNGDGLIQYLNETGNDRRFKAHFLAACTSLRSGTIQYRGQKYHYYCYPTRCEVERILN